MEPITRSLSQELRASFWGIAVGTVASIVLQFAFNGEWHTFVASGLGTVTAPLDVLLIVFLIAVFATIAGLVGAYPMTHARRIGSLPSQYALAFGVAVVLAMLHSLVRTSAPFDGLLFGVWLGAALASVALTDLFARHAMRVITELLHIVVGVFAAALIAALSTWSYPLAERDIWLVAYVAMGAVILMGIGPIRRAYAEDCLAYAHRGVAAGTKADSDA